MRQLTETEVRQFYVAYRAMEATAHTLKDEAERFHREAIKSAIERRLTDKVARGYHRVAIRYGFERDCLLLALAMLFLGIVFYRVLI